MTLQSIARTIAQARHGTDAHWAHYVGAAEAAVEELQKPTHEMIMAGAKEIVRVNDYREPDGDWRDGEFYQDAEAAFKAMLRALIAPRTKPWSVIDHLDSEEAIAAYLAAAYEDGDAELIKAAERDAEEARALIAQPDGAQ